MEAPGGVSTLLLHDTVMSWAGWCGSGDRGETGEILPLTRRSARRLRSSLTGETASCKSPAGFWRGTEEGAPVSSVGTGRLDLVALWVGWEGMCHSQQVRVEYGAVGGVWVSGDSQAGGGGRRGSVSGMKATGVGGSAARSPSRDGVASSGR